MSLAGCLGFAPGVLGSVSMGGMDDGGDEPAQAEAF